MRDNASRVNKYRYVLVIIAAVGIGLAIRFGARIWMDGEWRDIGSDLGMAVIVGAVVTLLYEANARAEFTGQTIAHVLKTVMGDLFATDLWEELRRQLLERRAIRRQFSVRFSLSRPDGLQAPRAILAMTTSYRLYALNPARTLVRIHHYLDDFMRNDAFNLPRYEFFSVGGELWPLGTAQCFDKEFDLSKHPEGLEVIVERKELVYTPGAYNFTLTDLTQIEHIQVIELPDDLQIEVNWLDGTKSFDAPGGCAINRVLLPGHSIDIRFKLKPSNVPMSKQT